MTSVNSLETVRIPLPIPLLLVLIFCVAGCGGSTSDPAEGTATSVEAADTTSAPAASVSSTLMTTTTAAPPARTIEAPPVLREEPPPLVDLDGWLASDISSLEELRGSVVVVEFWTFGCYNCKNRIPYNRDLYAKYQDQGLEIVGIHSPEFAYERDVANIEEAMVNLGVTWPVALDTERRTFRAWQGSPAYWPRTYVLDRQHRVRFDHIGEGAYEELDQVVGYLLTEGA